MEPHLPVPSSIDPRHAAGLLPDDTFLRQGPSHRLQIGGATRVCSATTVVSLPSPAQSGVLPGQGHGSLGDNSQLTYMGVVTLALSPLFLPMAFWIF